MAKQTLDKINLPCAGSEGNLSQFDELFLVPPAIHNSLSFLLFFSLSLPPLPLSQSATPGILPFLEDSR